MTCTAPCIIDLLRHGEPEGGVMYRGQRDDPLSETGWAQMRQAAAGIRHWQHVISSPLQRCQAFARQLADERGLPLSVNPALREISFGDWEGLTPEQVEARDGGRLAAFWADAERHPPPGGEPISLFHQRVAAAWHALLDTPPAEHLLIVAHGGVIRMILAEVLGLSPARAMAGFQVPFACRTRVRMDLTPHGRLVSLTSHGLADAL
ncbi:histidine phosphatase family protein [Isoalcanivorax indicus]|uniref:histidine phosphatase family protein n=1 Tax=Isoalcanivorax indicus TaxID=2202653 RepID=UPI001FE60003|nr:alpha-ribazole phosphatase family protein [Isoalcanivorax indicus]